MEIILFLTDLKTSCLLLILGWFHWNICILRVFKSVGQIPPPVQIRINCTLVQIKWLIIHLSFVEQIQQYIFI